MRLVCTACESTGIGKGMRAKFGELMNVCDACRGHGVLDLNTPEMDIVYIWAVSERYAVHMKVPPRKGGYVELDIAWSPRLPGKRGRSALTYREKEAYERGRTAALAAHMDKMGGGDYSVVKAEERH